LYLYFFKKILLSGILNIFEINKKALTTVSLRLLSFIKYIFILPIES
jgi:hypothetical protein